MLINRLSILARIVSRNSEHMFINGPRLRLFLMLFGLLHNIVSYGKGTAHSQECTFLFGSMCDEHDATRCINSRGGARMAHASIAPL